MKAKITLLAAAIALLVLAGWLAILQWHQEPTPSSRSAGLAAPATRPERPADERLANPSTTAAKPPETLATSRWQLLLDDQRPWQDRLALADLIRGTLPPEDVAMLYAALDHIPAPGTEEAWWVVLNEIMERMRKHGVGAAQYTTRLGTIIADPARPEVVRDYAAQHLMQWISPADPARYPGESNPQLVAQALQQITDVIRNPTLGHSTISGTALLAFTDASTRLPKTITEPYWAILDSYFATLWSNADSSSPAGVPLQSAALQAAARSGRSRHLPTIQKLATTPTTEPSLRLSAIAALGLYGGVESYAALAALSQQADRFSFAAKSALIRINQQRADHSN